MTTSWVITVTDLSAKDKAFKHVNASREETAIKVNSLLEKYETLFEKDRFRIEISSPHLEVDTEQRIKISCKIDEENKVNELFGQLHDLNPFMYKLDENRAYFEVDQIDTIPAGFVQI